jgi:putative radical SAM enzyme (TIGR03279 family)
MKGLLITQVLPGGIAEEMGLEPGDRILAINGHPLRDIIDYNFYSDGCELSLQVCQADGTLCEVSVERDEDEPMGLVFAPPEPEQCGNQCIFCFVHQLPRGLRRPLYVKDEDYRLSFLYGNYVTMGNLSEGDMERIAQQRLSPLYISVHATDEEVRRHLLGNEAVPPLLPIMSRLAGEGIAFHTQIVLCPGINDGRQLERTVADLTALHPQVRSVAVVPVGLTAHRRHLPALRAVDGRYAAELLERWETPARQLGERLGEPFLFFADEFYLQAGRPFPPLASYGELPQLENGVGLVPRFLAEAAEVLAAAEPLPPVAAILVTGASAFPILEEFATKLSRRTNATLVCRAVENRLFGHSVTVAGLVSGRDILAALAGSDAAGTLLLPDVMLKEGEGVFLDDLSVADLERELGLPVEVVESGPWGIYEAMMRLSER